MSPRWRLIFIVISLLSLASMARGGFDEGLAAYNRGDYTTAYHEFLPLAQRADARAQFYLGLMYMNGGNGVAQDKVKAAMWLRHAAEQDYDMAQNVLGLLLYTMGLRDRQYLPEAAKWYRKLAEQGSFLHQVEFGKMYEQGVGVLQDYAEAAKWYRKAAKLGLADAQARLGIMYEIGHGIPQDYVLAHMWFNLAAAQMSPGKARDDAAKSRDRVAARMSPVQIAEAQRLAREWKPKEP
jgi:hypothetical protein